MAHEFRHGFGYLIGELVGGSINPFYDMTDELVAFNTEFLFSDRTTANRVVERDFNIDWFKKNHHQDYSKLMGREESLSVNTTAATYLKYNFKDRISFILSNKSNINLTVKKGIDVINKHNQQTYGNPAYYYGTFLNNR